MEFCFGEGWRRQSTRSLARNGIVAMLVEEKSSSKRERGNAQSRDESHANCSSTF
jgi:hypothetical protein